MMRLFVSQYKITNKSIKIISSSFNVTGIHISMSIRICMRGYGCICRRVIIALSFTYVYNKKKNEYKGKLKSMEMKIGSRRCLNVK